MDKMPWAAPAATSVPLMFESVSKRRVPAVTCTVTPSLARCRPFVRYSSASCSTLELDPNIRWRWRRKRSGGRC